VIETRGQRYETLADAAIIFGVSTKTVRSWIRKGIIDEPPSVEYGVRTIAIFPPEYMARADRQLAAYRQQARQLVGSSRLPA
jgi:hypothetical protein